MKKNLNSVLEATLLSAGLLFVGCDKDDDGESTSESSADAGCPGTSADAGCPGTTSDAGCPGTTDAGCPGTAGDGDGDGGDGDGDGDQN